MHKDENMFNCCFIMSFGSDRDCDQMISFGTWLIITGSQMLESFLVIIAWICS